MVTRRSGASDTAGNLVRRQFTLEYWQDDGWYVGRLREVPGIFSQGGTPEALKEHIRDAYQLVMADEQSLKRRGVQNLKITVEV
jgi:predicted RNase H-like HicB family nuclease